MGKMRCLLAVNVFGLQLQPVCASQICTNIRNFSLTTGSLAIGN